MIELKVTHSTDPRAASQAAALHELHSPETTGTTVFAGDETWQRQRPETLVVACSDGRLQKSIDEFLNTNLGVTDYDRLYAPGGPGALGKGDGSHKTDQLQRELEFLMVAHRINNIVLLFHGADRTGPEDAVCAHYKRVLPGATRREINQMQHDDAATSLQLIHEIAPRVRVYIYRAEVSGNGDVKFVNLLKADSSDLASGAL